CVYLLYFHFNFLHCMRDHRYLHSFPTRRSSDLSCAWISYTSREQRDSAKERHAADGSHGPAGGQTGMSHRLMSLTLFLLLFLARSEEHTSELQSRFDLVCRLLLEKKKE